MTVRRLIEVDLPIRTISAHTRREKSIRHGHISDPAQMEWQSVMKTEHYTVETSAIRKKAAIQ